MRYIIILLSLLFLPGVLAQEKPIQLSKKKVEMRIDQLKKEYQELQRLVDDPALAVPNWKARMRQIEGEVGGLMASINDTTLIEADSLKTKPKSK
jgi:hypothetical protein